MGRGVAGTEIGESKEIGETIKIRFSSLILHHSTYAHKEWICLLDVLYTLHALVLFRVRGLDVKVRFALGAFGANGNEQIACLMAPTLSKTHIFST